MNNEVGQPKKKRRRRRRKGGGNSEAPVQNIVVQSPSSSVGNHVEGQDLVIQVPIEARFADILAWVSNGSDAAAKRFCNQAIRTALIKAKNDFEKTQLEDRAFERFKG